MARKRPEEEPDNHDRWIVSYADFITLLFALFAVMYSVSTLNKEKYEAISDSMLDAFSKIPSTLKTAANKKIPKPKTFPQPEEFSLLKNREAAEFDKLWPFSEAYSDLIACGQCPSLPETGPAIHDQPFKAAAAEPFPKLSEIVKPTAAEARPAPQTMEQIEQELRRKMAAEKMARVKQEMASMADEIKEVLGSLIQVGEVTVTQSEQGISIQINASVLFDSGKAALSQESIRVLGATAQVLAASDHRIQVEGYTDNNKVNNNQFASNWELSAHRAATVAHLFADKGIAGKRLTAIGHSENDPVDSNDTLQGKAHNRRVMVSILSAEEE